MPEILDSQAEALLCLPGKTVRHFHPKRQPNLTDCAGYRASAMRDKADGRVGVDHYSIILSSESVTIALTSGDSGRPPMAR